MNMIKKKLSMVLCYFFVACQILWFQQINFPNYYLLKTRHQQSFHLTILKFTIAITSQNLMKNILFALNKRRAIVGHLFVMIKSKSALNCLDFDVLFAEYFNQRFDPIIYPLIRSII